MIVSGRAGMSSHWGKGIVDVFLQGGADKREMLLEVSQPGESRLRAVGSL